MKTNVTKEISIVGKWILFPSEQPWAGLDILGQPRTFKEALPKEEAPFFSAYTFLVNVQLKCEFY